MDELVLEGETYFSTKRAAKETGYAKDYVGQLCREGRVTARLVGRSWYVLASAIREHRFGGSEPETAKAGTASVSQPPRLAEPAVRELPSLAWEPARYESVPNTPLPSINRLYESPAALQDQEKSSAESEVAVPSAATSDMQSVWSEWFEKAPGEPASVATTSPTVSLSQEAPQAVTLVDTQQSASERVPEDDATAIPLRPIPVVEDVQRPVTITRNVTEDWEKEEAAEAEAVQLSRDRAEERHRKELRAKSPFRGALWSCFALVLVLAALSFAAVAASGSGYFDKYLISFRQGSYFTGVSKIIK